MSYLTTQDLETRFGANELLLLAEDPVNAGTYDESRIALAIQDADAEIDSLLVLRFALPLSEVPAIIPKIAADLARYYLQDDRATEEAKTRYDAAIKTLKEIAQGQRDPLPLPEEVSAGTAYGGSSYQKTTADRIFTSSKLEGF